MVKEIIRKYLDQINEAWLAKKRYQFENSTFYEGGKIPVLYHQDVIAYSWEENTKYDKYGFLIDGEIKEILIDIDIDYNFTDFCVNSKEYYKNCDLLFINKPIYLSENIVADPARIEDLDDMANKLMHEIIEVSKFISSEKLELFIDEEIKPLFRNDIDEMSDNELSYLFNEFEKLVLKKLDEKFKFLNYAKQFNDGAHSLHFNLNMSGFSALLYLIGKTGIVNKKELIDFATKYFTYEGVKKTVTKPTPDNLNDRYSKHGLKKYGIKALGDIFAIFEKQYSIELDK